LVSIFVNVTLSELLTWCWGCLHVMDIAYYHASLKGGVVSSTLALPFWIVVVLSALAAVALVDRVVMPTVRWVLQRRTHRAISELNTRLKLRIQPFKITQRRVQIDRLMADPEVLQAIEEHARTTGVSREVASGLAMKYAREIVPSFSAYAYFKIGAAFARRVSQALYRVRVGFSNDEALKQIDPDASVIFVINHRSNMDYVLVTYVASSSSALSYAVGEWARIWGLSGLIRSMGAYFIRRDSRDGLYRKVLSRYVHTATAAGVVQAIFPEGGLSRDGRLRPPKFGLLSYMVSGFDSQGAKDVVFIPVGVNYDRVLEDRVLTSTVDPEKGSKPVFRFNPWIFTKFVLGSLWLKLRGRWFRYGYACVSFGEPLSLRRYVGQHRFDFRTLEPAARHEEIEKLGSLLMERVGRAVPALPVSLVTTVLLEADFEPLTVFELKARVANLIERIERTGAHVHIPRSDRDYAVDVGLRMLVLRRLVSENEGRYSGNRDEIALLAYYANSIEHLVKAPVAPVRGLFAVALG
jgi:glycerol-3-phosphate O-acyltransferase